MNIQQLSDLSGINLSDLAIVENSLGKDNFQTVLSAVDNLTKYMETAKGRGIDQASKRFNVIYHLVRLYSKMLATKEGDLENIGRGLIKAIVPDEPTRELLYVELFDRGGVHEKLTVVKRPA